MHPDQIKALVAQWIHSELERTEQAKADRGTNELEEADDYKDVYGTLLEEADEARQMNQQWKVKDLALELTARHGLHIRVSQSDGVRTAGCRSVGWWQLNRQQPNVIEASGVLLRG
ncbi:MAG: hypothetical protein LKG23_13330 [Nitrospira sp.]|jgi:hypothetical protein|nr:hypothetical protein [Nitrospira sp.]